MATEDLMLAAVGEERDDPVLAWRDVFGNGNPVEVELGIGKGRFVIDAAQRHPDRNYIGIERATKYLRLAHDRSLKRNLRNIRFARVDAQEFIEFFVAAESLRAVHLYFPDPWPKKRHHKRRLFQTGFLEMLAGSTMPNAEVFFSTDHGEYARWVLALFIHSPFFSWEPKAARDWCYRPPNIVSTRYETKALRAGRRSIFLKFRRNGVMC